MTWRGTNTTEDRVIAGLTYLVPLLEVWPFGFVLALLQFPALQPIYQFPAPLLSLYFFSIGGIQIVSFAIFFAVYLGIVRNENFRHFVRFHAMQAILLAIVIYLISAVLSLLGLVNFPLGFEVVMSGYPVPVILAIIFDAVFLAGVGAVIFSIVQAARGLYAEIPYISDAVYMQVR
ncbi:MAG: Tic20 family protein [Leptolyngbyaceae cyanobacterium bins.59]|nr:Tic20 family protein [Leptolyngbyaceae cyanobacterium bins.59]